VALGEYLRVLEKNSELHRTQVDIDPHLELTEVAQRAIREGKPALLIEHPKNSLFPVCVNHYASRRRIELALDRHPDEIGEELITFLERVFPPTLRNLLDQRPMLQRFLHAPSKQVSGGISQEVVELPDLDALPIQFCWPEDGGRFITYGQVFTYDPRDGKRNIGIYRMHVFDKQTTGMHWQIQKGGGFHYYQSETRDKHFEVAVALGTDPALLLATVAALPEGLDEALFAGFLQGRRVKFTKAKHISVPVPASAEFILEGIVPARERRMEGPFGDHFGHYSAAAEFPVFHVKMITRRKHPVYPAIVVGKPPMEDKFLGDATQQMLGPLIRLIHKEIRSLWAYYEAGFHNLLAIGIEQRYQKEAMKAALGLMGTDQLSLTKCMIAVSAGVDVRDWHLLLKEIRENFDPHYDFVMIPKVPLDTLDFTSYKMNLGSKMIIDATRKPWRKPEPTATDTRLTCDIGRVRALDSRIGDAVLIDETLLIVKLSDDPSADGSAGKQILEKLLRFPPLARLPMAAVVSHDVDLRDKESYIWGIFTRFDCERDVLFTDASLVGISPVYRGTMGIDATWKPGYPKPLVMTDEIVKRVDEKWGQIWKR
jgi:UbiD family decarboxylase